MGRRAGIDKTRIVDIAAAIANENGLDGLSLAAIAAELGVKSPSLYNHVAGLGEIHELLAGYGATALATALETSSNGKRGATALATFKLRNRQYPSHGPSTTVKRRSAPSSDDEA